MNRIITQKQLKQLKDENKFIFFIKNKVYDATDFIEKHPGGKQILIMSNFKELSSAYSFHSKKGKKIWDSFLIGYKE